jgi:hypothetical protein
MKEGKDNVPFNISIIEQPPEKKGRVQGVSEETA